MKKEASEENNEDLGTVVIASLNCDDDTKVGRRHKK